MYQIMKTTFKRIKSTPVTAGFLLFGLVVSMLMVSIGTSFISEIVNVQEDKMENAPPNALMFKLSLNSENSVSVDEFVRILGNADKSTGTFVNEILLNIDKAGVDSYFPVSAECFFGDTGWHYPIYEGRYYSIDDIKNGRKVALIGSGIKKYVQEENGQSFIKIFGEKYKVIGTVGFKGRRSLWDTRLFMPLTSLPKLAKQNIESGNASIVIYNAQKDTQGEIEKIVLKAKELYPKAEVLDCNKIGSENMLSQVVANPDIFLYIGILSYIVSIVYAINMVSFWIEQRRYEIGVRKAFGHTNFYIASLIFQEMFGISALAFILALLLQMILGLFLNEIMNYTINLYIQNIIVGLTTVALTAALTTIWPVIKSLRIQPVETMKL